MQIVVFGVPAGWLADPPGGDEFRRRLRGRPRLRPVLAPHPHWLLFNPRAFQRSATQADITLILRLKKRRTT
ncbi:MAG: hypothetical protein AWU57_621 [Marinobacter sp. T13-3]|nr:MAG: hypothetical protein AWU57_621 [Marinobacter sp. T13-3]